MHKLRVVVAVVAWTILALTGVARGEGFQLDRFPTASAPADLLWVERADAKLGTLDPYVRTSLFYADKPLVLAKVSDPGQQYPLVASQFGLRAAVGLALHKRLLAGVVLAMAAQSSRAEEVGMAKPSAVGVGSPGVDGRFILLDRSDPVEVAIAATLFFPVGSSDALVADDSFRARPRVILSRGFMGKGVVSGSIGGDFHRTASYGSLQPGSEMTFAVGAFVPFGDDWGGTAELGGSSVLAKMFEGNYTPIEATGGLRFEGLGGMVAQVGAGTGLTHGFGTPVVRLLATLGYAVAPATGAAPTPAPAEPAPVPVVTAETDRDHDGLLDAADKCPDQAEDKDGFQDADGCPELDNDGDAIADGIDKCPDQAEDKDGFQDADGCPEPDNDGDGVLDVKDECPNEPETKNGYKDEDGCPDYVKVESSQIRTLEPIFFATKSDKILDRSAPLLLELANVIKARADLGRISVDGHTDARGGAAYNMQLSARRAASVRKFLIEAGVPDERLESHGFGQTKPIADNKSEAGRATNRRVEFRLVESEIAVPATVAPPTTDTAPRPAATPPATSQP